MGKKNWVRYLLGAVSIVYIVYMWTEKNVAGIYGSMSKEQLIPMIVTSVAVSLGKVALITAAILVIKWLAGKISGGK